MMLDFEDLHVRAGGHKIQIVSIVYHCFLAAQTWAFFTTACWLPGNICAILWYLPPKNGWHAQS
jgi:hypothetical protein